ncbi:MAG: hypothetical protein M2R45_02770 [Verrucomicrobia subdivision 3 bacterium]|nr:hypothetical protein [Limisphaerales bacterium]MCS1414319.1 hypothetical protein [Limisphaerales bacterium]
MKAIQYLIVGVLALLMILSVVSAFVFFKQGQRDDKRLKREVAAMEMRLANSLNQKLAKATEDLKSLREETEHLRGLMWGATAKNRRAIDKLVEAEKASVEWEAARDSVPCCGGDEGLLTEDTQSQLSEAIRSQHAVMMKSIEDFRASLDEDGLAELESKTNERLETMFAWSMEGLPAEMRGQVNQVLKEHNAKEEMRKSVERSILLQMLSASKFR